jgi:hypothetical protein
MTKLKGKLFHARLLNLKKNHKKLMKKIISPKEALGKKIPKF